MMALGSLQIRTFINTALFVWLKKVNQIFNQNHFFMIGRNFRFFYYVFIALLQNLFFCISLLKAAMYKNRKFFIRGVLIHFL